MRPAPSSQLRHFCLVIVLWITSGVDLCGQELIPDPHFQRGFVVLDPKPGRHVRSGTLNLGGSTNPPEWGLAQWSSRFPLDIASRTTNSAGYIVLSNAAKTVRLRPTAGTGPDLVLAANSAEEYGRTARSAEQPWVHLLVEQDFKQTPFLDQITAARLHVEARLVRAHNLHQGDYDPGRHAAQFQIFLTVQNRRPGSPGHGDLLWFGIPIYDNRHRQPPEFKSRDFGGTGKFIFTPAASVFTTESAHDQRWITIDYDLLPLLREAVETAWAKGFLPSSQKLEDYAIGGMNLGWELPGTFDVELELRNLSLRLDRADQTGP